MGCSLRYGEGGKTFPSYLPILPAAKHDGLYAGEMCISVSGYDHSKLSQFHPLNITYVHVSKIKS